MENQNNELFNLPHLPLQMDVYAGVKKRLLQRRIEAQQTRQWLAAAAIVLLVLATANVGITVVEKRKTSALAAPSAAEILHEAYFTTSQSWFYE